MPPDQCRGGRDQQQGPGDHQAYLWTEVSEESVGPIDPGLESGVASDRLLDRAHPPDGQGPEGPIRLVLHLKTEEPSLLKNFVPCWPMSSPTFPHGTDRAATGCIACIALGATSSLGCSGHPREPWTGRSAERFLGFSTGTGLGFMPGLWCSRGCRRCRQTALQLSLRVGTHRSWPSGGSNASTRGSLSGSGPTCTSRRTRSQIPRWTSSTGSGGGFRFRLARTTRLDGSNTGSVGPRTMTTPTPPCPTASERSGRGPTTSARWASPRQPIRRPRRPCWIRRSPASRGNWP